MLSLRFSLRQWLSIAWAVLRLVLFGHWSTRSTTGATPMFQPKPGVTYHRPKTITLNARHVAMLACLKASHAAALKERGQEPKELTDEETLTAIMEWHASQLSWDSEGAYVTAREVNAPEGGWAPVTSPRHNPLG